MTVPEEAAQVDAAPGRTRLEAGALLRRAAAHGAARAGPHLVVREPRSAERVLALNGDGTVGRASTATFRLADPSASRLHLRIHLDEAGATVEDLGSRNGVRLNGRRLRGLRRLQTGDQLEAGQTLLRYVDPLQPLGAASGPGASWRHPPFAAWLALAAALLALAAILVALA